MDTTTNRQDPAHRSGVPARGGKGVLWTIALVLLIVGGINWGLVGLFGIDLVATLFGDMSGLSRVVYVLVGIAALISVFALPRVARAG
jgi:uncharacterized membrane protein YuzA (DUF378 family)